MVLDALASYLGHLLSKVAADELGTMLGVPCEIDKMGDKLRDLKNFLADADRRNITDQSVQEWVGQLKRTMYEATDILDLCQLKAIEHGPSSTVDAGCFNPLLFCLRDPLHAREIGTRIKALNKRLDSIKQRSAAFSFINLSSYEDHHNSKMHTANHGGSSRETSPELDRSGVVGEKIEEDTRALVAQITQTGKDVNNNIMVVGIVGVGGIGKTTLAQKVFNDENIQAEFSKKIWLSVNQNFNETELLTRAIIEAGGQPTGNAKATLHRNLKDALIGHKTLLVLDDVWNHGAWEGVLKTPLVNVVSLGSRVLITTRDEGVARGIRATWPYHHVDALAPDDAWSLLKKQVLSSEIDEGHIEALKDIGLKIIQKCGGLPLAVKVMGGLLYKRGELRRDWQQVLDDAKWSIAEMPQELNNAVYLSYADMPSYLKQCFLYYSLLPKSRMFNLDQVIGMWMSEGIIHGNSSDLEELGIDYYKDLVSRNLIEPDKSYPVIWVCHMHDVVRSFAHYMTKDESLIAHSADNDIMTKLCSQKFLRLSIETDQSQSCKLDWKSLQKQQSMRTLISSVLIKSKPGDSLVNFSSLRTLHLESADVAEMVESLHQLKHLRYLALVNSDISALPVNIGKMKLLQYLDLRGCKNLVNIPGSIMKLSQLRILFLANVSMIPRGFCGLTNMRNIAGFKAHMDDNWCSLDELGPLSQLKVLELLNLENVTDASFATNAKLGEKVHLIKLSMRCTSILGHEWASEEEQQLVEKVFDELCPPSSLESLSISGYFGQQLPSWMMSRSIVPLNNLKDLYLSYLAYCTQLSTGLCELPYLQHLQVHRAPCIKRVGTRFLQAPVTPFPSLNKMILIGMVKWEEWQWEQQVLAMPRLEQLWIYDCKLWRIPPGLTSNARALKKLTLKYIQNLSYLENFPSVIELELIECHQLERISNLPSLLKLTINCCSKLKVIDSIPALERLVLGDYAEEELPEYMRDINSRHLQIDCRVWLLAQLAAGQSGTEWDKFSHVEQVKAYAQHGSNQRKWYMVYTKSDNFKLDSNVSSSTIFEETLSSSMVGTQGFEHLYKMRRSTFSYVCSLVKVPFFEHMMVRDHTFVDGRVLSLEDRVAVAVRMLNSGEPPEIVGSSVDVNASTVLLVTHRFVEAMWERAMHHLIRPSSAKMEEIKRKFDKIHGLPNCCGVLNTAHIMSGSQNGDHDDDFVMQVVVDPDMRFTNFWLEQSARMDRSSILHDSKLFKDCQEGTWLNGSKLKVSSGGGPDVREYIVGDAGYPLLPWLLTPYHLEDKELTEHFPPYQAEFNRRHASASTLTLAALARLKDTWKILDREMWSSLGSCPLHQIIYACCILHNIVIDMEEEGAGMENYIEQVQNPSGEDGVRIREEEQEKVVVDEDDPDMEEHDDEEKEKQDAEEKEKEVLVDRDDDEEHQYENYMEAVESEAEDDDKDWDWNYIEAVWVRDALSHHLVESGVHTMAAEEEHGRSRSIPTAKSRQRKAKSA